MILIIIILMIASTFLAGIGSFYLKKGSEKISRKIISFILNKALIIGGVIYLLSAIVYIYTLKLGELSIIYPLSSLSYIWVLIISRIFLKEELTKTKLLSITLIISGIFFIVS